MICKYTMPGFISNYKINHYLLEEMRINPHIFYKDIIIDSVFDSFPSVVWNGGRLNMGVPYSIDRMKETIKSFNEVGIGIRYTFTNHLLEKKHLGDVLGNCCLELAHSEMNGVIVNNPILEEYIRRNFPKYKLISSIIMNTVSSWEERIEKYDMNVIPMEMNRDLDFIGRIKNKEKIEILINERCFIGCEYRKDHWFAEADDQLNYRSNGEGENINYIENHCHVKNLNEENAQLSLMEVDNLKELGIINLKIQGRSQPQETVLDDYCKYMVIPQYHEEFRQKYHNYM